MIFKITNDTLYVDFRRNNSSPYVNAMCSTYAIFINGTTSGYRWCQVILLHDHKHYLTCNERCELLYSCGLLSWNTTYLMLVQLLHLKSEVYTCFRIIIIFLIYECFVQDIASF